MSDVPLVSVIIPTYYRNNLLEECLISVDRQTYDNIEIIIVDDSGERNAASVVEKFESITYIPFEKNRGPNEARNAGIRASSGDYIQLLDDDDLLHPEKIEQQVELLADRREIGVVYCGGWSDEVGEFSPKVEARGDVLRLALQFELPSCVTSTMLIRREIIEEVYPLPDVPGADDTYWKIEFAQLCQFDYIDEPLVTKRSPNIRRGKSRGAVDGTRDIINKYADVYAQFDDDVLRIAESKVIGREAMYYLRKRPYSLYAIWMFFRSIRHHPNPSLKLYFRLAASLGGRRLFYYIRKVRNSVKV